MDVSANNEILQAIFREGKKLTFAKYDPVLQDEETPQGIHYIQSGYIKVFSLNERGEEYIHLLYGPGDMFPLFWLTGTMRKNTYFSALSDCVLYRIPKEDILDIIGLKNPRALSIFQQIMQQFRLYIDRVDNLEYKYARERLAYRLLYLAHRFGTKIDNGYIIDAPITQHTLASSINLSRETVSRELDRLIRKNIITAKDRKFTILDARALSQELPDSKIIERLGL